MSDIQKNYDMIKKGKPASKKVLIQSWSGRQAQSTAPPVTQ